MQDNTKNVHVWPSFKGIKIHMILDASKIVKKSSLSYSIESKSLGLLWFFAASPKQIVKKNLHKHFVASFSTLFF